MIAFDKYYNRFYQYDHDKEQLEIMVSQKDNSIAQGDYGD